MVRNFPVCIESGAATHVVTSAANVPSEMIAAAKEWPIWDSGQDFAKVKQPKFVLRYRKEERVLVLEGKAQLTPQDGGAPFIVQAGDAVTFHAGFVADWCVLDRMRKHYQYFESSGEPCEEPSKATPVIACDVCGKEAVEEYIHLSDSKEDVCAKCVKVARGPDKRRYAACVPCRRGVPVGGAEEEGKKRKATAQPAKKPAKVTKA